MLPDLDGASTPASSSDAGVWAVSPTPSRMLFALPQIRHPRDLRSAVYRIDTRRRET